jgi:DNA-binding MurR/RpiR family transcriptional regulator
VNERHTEPGKIEEQIRQLLQDFSKSERQVGLVILADYPATALGSVASIASQAQVSGATVLRFVKSLGFASFPDFKMALREEIAIRSSGPLGRALDLRAAEGEQTSLAGHISSVTENALLSAQRIPVGEWNGLIDLLCDTSRPLSVTGGRFSMAVARDLALNLQLMRPRVQFLTDVDYADQAVLMDMTRKSVFVVYDFARYQRSLIYAAALAHRAGASVVLFTDGELSPIRSDAEIVIPVSTHGPSPFSGLAIPTLLTEVALGAVYERLGTVAEDQLARWEIVRSTEVINEPQARQRG